jgi:hypothetical protein
LSEGLIDGRIKMPITVKEQLYLCESLLRTLNDWQEGLKRPERRKIGDGRFRGIRLNLRGQLFQPAACHPEQQIAEAFSPNDRTCLLREERRRPMTLGDGVVAHLRSRYCRQVRKLPKGSGEVIPDVDDLGRQVLPEFPCDLAEDFLRPPACFGMIKVRLHRGNDFEWKLPSFGHIMPHCVSSGCE